MTRRTAIAAVVVLFLASVVCRIPFLTRPLQGEHDWLTIQSLLAISYWQNVGLARAHYSPSMSQANPADKFIPFYRLNGVRLLDKEGAAYYVSFPPFAYLLGFWVCSVLPVLPPISLKLINLALLLPAVLVLYLMLERIFNKGDSRSGSTLAVLGVALFLFNRAVLLSYGNLYFPVTLVIPLWIMAVYFYLAAQSGPRRRSRFLGLFFLFSFLACYCDWTGIAAAVGFFLWSLVRKHRQRVDLWSGGLAVGSAVLAVSLMVAQYSLINGFRNLWEVLVWRFNERAGIQPLEQAYTAWSPATIHAIYSGYLEQYKPMLLLLLGLVLIYAFSPRLFSWLRWTPEARRLLFLFAFPVAFDNLVLSNLNAYHNFTNLKAAPILTIVCVFLMGGLAQYLSRDVPSQDRQWTLTAPSLLAPAVVMVCLFATRSYLGERVRLDPSDSNLGAAIGRNSNNRQVIFMMRRTVGDVVTPNLAYFSGRSVQIIDQEQDAVSFLRSHNQPEGVVFRASLQGDLVAPPHVIRAGEE